LPRRDKDDPTDLEDLTSWASLIIGVGGFAVAIIVLVLTLAFCAL
jgi:hypothetical protein